MVKIRMNNLNFLRAQFLIGVSLLGLGLGSSFAINAEIRNKSDNSVVTDLDFGSVPVGTTHQTGLQYAKVTYILNPPEPHLNSLGIATNNIEWNGPPPERGGVQNIPARTERGILFRKVFSTLQTSPPVFDATTESTWTESVDTNDPGYWSTPLASRALPTHPSGETYVYFGVKLNANSSVSRYQGSIKVRNYPVEIVTHPAPQIIPIQTAATFSVTANGGTPLLNYQWFKDNQPISGATSDSYTTPVVDSSNFSNYDGAQFFCRVSNSLNESADSNPARLTVLSAPIITVQPQSQTITEGQPVTFSVTAIGTPVLEYQWFENGDQISGAISASYLIPTVNLSHEGHRFKCVIRHPLLGWVESGIATLTVTPLNGRPQITEHPQTQIILAGGDVTFRVRATSSIPMEYQWRMNGIAINGERSDTLVGTGVPATLNGTQFDCIVSNQNGGVTSNPATLFVYSLPTISQHPISQSITQGQPVTFSVTASGAPPLTYQWYKNRTPISGATSASYSIANVLLTDNGAYGCVVTDPLSQFVISNEATLTVIPPVPSYALTVVDGSGSGRYTTGTIVTITANAPLPGRVFERWVGATVLNPTLPSTTLTMPAANTTVTATYRELGGNVSLEPNGFGRFHQIFEGPSMLIPYSLDKTADVSMKIYGRNSNEVRELVHETKTPGNYSASWDGFDQEGESAPSGLYYFVLRIAEDVFRVKVARIK